MNEDLRSNLQSFIEEAMGSVPYSVSSRWIARRMIMMYPDVFKDEPLKKLTVSVARRLTAMREENRVEITFQTTYGHREYRLVVS